MERIPKTSPHVILYFDILGYKSFLGNGIIEERYIMHAIRMLVAQVKGYSKDIKNCKSLVFSDNCVICFRIKSPLSIPYIFSHAVAAAQFLERNLLLHGLFIRGSICIGDVYISNNYIFGNGIIKAYEFENGMAIYPRIIVDSELVEFTLQYLELIREGVYVELPQEIILPEIIDEKNMFVVLSKLHESPPEDLQLHNSIKVRKDFDGQYFVDMLQNIFSEYTINNLQRVDLSKTCVLDSRYYAIPNSTLYGTDNKSISDINLALCLICTRVLNGFRSSISNPKVNAKYLWFCGYINQFYREIGLEEPFSPSILYRWGKESKV